MTQKVKEYYIY